MLDSGNARESNGLREEWDLRVGRTSTREESRWVQMNLHCQVKPRLVSGSLKTRLVAKNYSQVWTRLCRYLLPGREDDICADDGVVSSNLSLVASSVEHQECLAQ